MKKLIFLENDYQCPSSDEDLRSAKRQLKNFGLSIELINDIKIIYQFKTLSKEEKHNIVFDENNILITHSVYTDGSDTDFMYLVAGAARNQINNITYIDTSGSLIRFLNEELKNYNDILFGIICGINTNIILTRDENLKLKRIKINISGYYDDVVTLEDYLGIL